MVVEKIWELIEKDLLLKDVLMNFIFIDYYLWDFRCDYVEEMWDNILFYCI